MQKSYVYIMTNISNTVLYIGVTSDLKKRVNQHKYHTYKGFTDTYNCTKLVYFEEYSDIKNAIAREKQMKNWRRNWKKELITKNNPNWQDLAK
ncbi:MAG: GIY-YIG nuclease family protein [Spirochaetaceae bacterium]|nr:GIY-YIG nuclease family protein [Spirochaetaceae bacterium]